MIQRVRDIGQRCEQSMPHGLIGELPNIHFINSPNDGEQVRTAY